MRGGPQGSMMGGMVVGNLRICPLAVEVLSINKCVNVCTHRSLEVFH